MFTKLVVLCLSLTWPVSCSEKNPRILIIGAGASGIAAATRLWKANFTDLTILEAENRIGGRVNSVKFGDAYVDLGGEWCHGEKGNIVYSMVKNLNALRHSDLKSRLVYSNGSYIDDEIYRNLINFSESVDASVPNPEKEERCGNFSSIGECVDQEFNSTFHRIYRNDPDKLRVSLEAKEWLEHYMVGYDSPSSLSELSRGSDYRRCEGDFALNWNGRGYRTVLDVMMQKYPDPSQELPIDDHILLNREVSRISWNDSDSRTVTVQTSDNSSFEVDHVIFTSSLGVLKHHHVKMFNPSLPEEKVSTIRKAGFGAILKIILHFNETWWNPEEMVGLVWSTKDRNNIKRELGTGPEKDGRSWLTTMTELFTADNNPRVLVLFFSGSMVPDIERTDDQVLINGLMYMFRKFLGKHYNIVQPDQMIKSAWYSNPHFHGTYSYDSIDGNSKEYKFPDRLAAPLTRDGIPVVQFAGEATHPHYFSTVHGAIETGYREADRLIKLYAKE
ncbi:hypothetical protein NQ317_019005 [Molorchus minor]|uniref:Amine oxidase domain-containing protein n=1 Tax=Molorchus minor TaxID=1323400 RepID=A0ABQ9JS11_9CUCU|nr:hypothetical protein NQ317_019005 [Molorchus minor]